jgi:hypothetical protein
MDKGKTPLPRPNIPIQSSSDDRQIFEPLKWPVFGPPFPQRTRTEKMTARSSSRLLTRPFGIAIHMIAGERKSLEIETVHVPRCFIHENRLVLFRVKLRRMIGRLCGQRNCVWLHCEIYK